MRIANVNGRASVIVDNTVLDVYAMTNGWIGPDPMDVYRNWKAVADSATATSLRGEPLDQSTLGCPVPAPRQVFAIGLNYRRHAEESGMAVPPKPATFNGIVGVNHEVVSTMSGNTSLNPGTSTTSSKVSPSNREKSSEL